MALVVQDDQPPFSFVVVTGEATWSEDPDELRTWATRLGGRYMAGLAEAYGASNGPRRAARPGHPDERRGRGRHR